VSFSKSELMFLYDVLGFIDGGPIINSSEDEEMQSDLRLRIRSSLCDSHQEVGGS
jgi:hypothetical protein